MGIPKKKSRRIVIEGRPFRWLLKGNSRLIGDTPQSIRFIAQEDEDRPGRPFVLDLLSKRWTPDFADWGGHHAAVTPHDAETLIRTGLIHGWNPSERGGAFTLDMLIDVAEFATWT